jgi:SAM-dependent methyltransferase
MSVAAKLRRAPPITGIRGLLVGNDESAAERLRRRRWKVILRHIPGLADVRVVDLGGTDLFWLRAPVRPRHVTVVNLHEAGEDSPGVTAIEGDALRADTLLRGEEFDLAFSNSLIEHLGGHGSRRRFAEIVRSLAPGYLVQTPYRYFPLEPHWLFPAFQFLPVPVRSRVAPRWPLGHTYGWEPHAAAEEVMATELLSGWEMREYFPDANIVWERVAGVPKSMIAIRYSPR